jgi:hypothetical protein
VLEKDLGLTFTPAIEGATAVPPAPIKLPPALLPTVGGVVALLLGAVLAFLLVRMALTRPMDGVLTFTRDGREIADIVLRGRRQKLAVPAGTTELVGLSGSASGARGAVHLDASFGAARARGVVAEAKALQLGDMTITYVSGRRRILEKIGLPTTGTPSSD